VQIRSGGDLLEIATGRFRGGWGVNPDKPYLGALAPNADDSAVVGEADVADDGAQ